MQKLSFDELKHVATVIRRDILTMTTKAKSGHPGGSLSGTDLLVSLYANHLRHDPQNPKWEGRDRFVLSKGHCCPLLYAVLAHHGYFPREQLMTLRRLHSMLQGHPDMKKVPGVEISTGSLGQGLSVSVGMALGFRQRRLDTRVFVLLGCGEMDEGQVWEAGMAASHYKLDNLTAMLDYNQLQIDGPNEKVMTIAPIADKWRAFGFDVVEIDGHDYAAIDAALAGRTPGKPRMIVARTHKGHGVSFMEDVVDYHGKPLSEDELAKALAELGGASPA